jgi:hypothetical protein
MFASLAQSQNATRRSSAGLVSSAAAAGLNADWSELAVVAAACSRRPGVVFSRGDIARLFEVTTRTVTRWETRFDLPVERTNARVLRYTLVSVILLCARGHQIKRGEAELLGLYLDKIFTVAATWRNRVCKDLSVPDLPALPETGIFIAVTPADRLIVSQLKDPAKLEAYRALARGWAA